MENITECVCVCATLINRRHTGEHLVVATQITQQQQKQKCFSLMVFLTVGEVVLRMSVTENSRHKHRTKDLH